MRMLIGVVEFSIGIRFRIGELPEPSDATLREDGDLTDGRAEHHRRAGLGRTRYLKMSGNACGAPRHAAKPEAVVIGVNNESRAVVLDHELRCVALNVEIDVER